MHGASDNLVPTQWYKDISLEVATPIWSVVKLDESTVLVYEYLMFKVRELCEV